MVRERWGGYDPGVPPEILWALAGLLVLLGLAGTVLPALPGVPLVFLGLLLGAWIDGFRKVGPVALVVLALLTLASIAVDLLSTALGAKKAGASRAAVVGSALGAFVGLFFGLPGLFVGPFAGALLGELYVRRDWKQAGKAGLATWLGIVLGTAVKIALAFTMVGIFVLAWVV